MSSAATRHLSLCLPFRTPNRFIAASTFADPKIEIRIKGDPTHPRNAIASVFQSEILFYAFRTENIPSMGVRGFMRFVSDNGLFEDDVCLARYACDHAARNGLDESVLVVDVLNLVRIIYGDLDWVCGGQHKQFEERLRRLVGLFERCGIHPVFVMDGSCPQDKFGTWLKRKEDKFRGIVRVVDEMYESGQDLPSPTMSRWKDPSERWRRIHSVPNIMVGHVLKDMGCEVLCAKGDADKTLSEIADERRAFGILSGDSDYIFFPTHDVALFSNQEEHLESPLWLLSERLTTRKIMPDAVAKGLAISREQMPLLASLIGNDIVTSDDLKEFHRSLVDGGEECHNKLIRLLSDRVRNVQVNEIPIFVEQTFQEEKLVSKVLRSIDSYVRRSDVTPVHHLDHNFNEPSSHSADAGVWDDIIRRFDVDYYVCKAPINFLIMLGHPMQLSVLAEDPRLERTHLSMAADVYGDLRRRMYGILLLEKPGAVDVDRFVEPVQEWVLRGLHCLDRLRGQGPDTVMPIAPPRELHPGLLPLHYSRNPSLDIIRWRLFAFCISGSDNAKELDFNYLAALNQSEIYLFCTLFVMTQQRRVGFIREHEVKAFILQHFMLKKLKVQDIENIELDTINVRAVHLASLYCFSLIGDLAWAVGNVVPAKSFLPSKIFDGKLFQHIFQGFDRVGRKKYWESEFAGLAACDEAEADEAESILKYLQLDRRPFRND